MDLGDVRALPYLLAFRRGFTLGENDGTPVLQTGDRTISLRAASKEVLAALAALSSGGASAQWLVERAAPGGDVAQAKILYYLDRFKQLGLFTYSAFSSEHIIATLIPTSNTHPAMPTDVDPNTRYALSRFASLHREGTHFLLESPLGHAKIQLFDPRASALCHLMAEPQTADELCQQMPSLSPEAVAMLLGLLLGCKAAAASDALDGAGQQALQTWSFHDLLFHARSRKGRHTEPYGATYPFKNMLEPLPAIKSKMAGAIVRLHRPDMEAPMRQDVAFTRVMEERRSIRAHDDKPLRADQIGEFFYRCARVRMLRDRDETSPYAITSRPYPGGGACYELEIYLAVAACDGLDAGLYHYDPLDHTLTMISGPSQAVVRLLDDARTTAPGPGPLHTLIVIAARFARLSWKYESMAYAALLKNVGVLYQTMYLVATAMGLAPCALGGGNSDLFAEAAGLDYYAETSVGEFILGSLPSPAQGEATGNRD